MAGHVMAQESEDAQAAEDEQMIEEIVVTGFRQSLQNAMEIKRDSELIVEAISADEFGKLPDNSIAEALTRLTGLAGQRLNGRQQVISIRGLAPDFSTALLNGRQQVSAGDNRGVEFDQYPSELLSEVVVYKTPAASLTGQGLARDGGHAHDQPHRVWRAHNFGYGTQRVDGVWRAKPRGR